MSTFRDRYIGSHKHYQDLKTTAAVERVSNRVGRQADAQAEAVAMLAHKLDEGSRRLTAAQTAAGREHAELVGRELRYMQAQVGELRSDVKDVGRSVDRAAGAITEAVDLSAHRVTLAVENLAGYVNRGFDRQAEEQAKTNRRLAAILDVLRHRLTAESLEQLDKGRQCLVVDETELAQRHLLDAVKADATNFEAHYLLGHIAVEFDDPDGADRRFELAGKFAPEGYWQAMALASRGRVAVALDKPQEAIPLLEAAVAADPNLALVHFELALLLAAHGDPERAVAVLEDAIRLDWNYWVLAGIEEGFDGIREAVSAALTRLKTFVVQVGRDRLQLLRRTCDVAGRVLPPERLPALSAAEHPEGSGSVCEWVALIGFVDEAQPRLCRDAEEAAAGQIDFRTHRLESLRREHAGEAHAARLRAEREAAAPVHAAHMEARERTSTLRHRLDGRIEWVPAVIATPLTLVAAVGGIVWNFRSLTWSEPNSLDEFIQQGGNVVTLVIGSVLALLAGAVAGVVIYGIIVGIMWISGRLGLRRADRESRREIAAAERSGREQHQQAEAELATAEADWRQQEQELQKGIEDLQAASAEIQGLVIPADQGKTRVRVGPQVPASLRDRIAGLVAGGRTIEAIKLLRTETGWSLAEAKSAIEE